MACTTGDSAHSVTQASEVIDVVDGIDCSALPGDGCCNPGPQFCPNCTEWDLAQCGTGGGGPIRGPSNTSEVCDDAEGDDEDGDGLANCEDTDCWNFSATVNTARPVRHYTETFHLSATIASTGHCDIPSDQLRVSWEMGDGSTYPDRFNEPITHRYGDASEYNVTATIECDGLACGQETAQLDVVAFDATIESRGPGWSDIAVTGTDAAADGRLSVVAQIEPPSATDRVSPLLRWSLLRDDAIIVASYARWGSGSDTCGRGAIDELLITDWPERNSDFGEYDLRLHYAIGPDGCSSLGELTTAPMWLFFDPGVVRDIGGMDQPNWYHYWLQAFVEAGRTLPTDAELAYEKVNRDKPYSHATTAIGYSYVSPPRPRIVLHDHLFTDAIKHPISGIRIAGITRFIAGLDHEVRHLHQWRTCSLALLTEPSVLSLLAAGPSAAGQVYTNGWSRLGGTAPHNHIAPGIDGKPGSPGYDDDGDGIEDNTDLKGFLRELHAAASRSHTPFNAAESDDVQLYSLPDGVTNRPDGYRDRLGHVNWCNALGPKPVNLQLQALELQGDVPDYFQRPAELDAWEHGEERVTHEGQYGALDWSVGGDQW